MSKYKLKELEREHGVPLDVLIPQILNELGTQKAAAEALNVAHSTVTKWCKENGYVQRVQWVKLGRAS